MQYLRRNGLPEVEDAVVCHRCGAEKQHERERGGEFRPVLGCRQRVCQTTRSVRQGNVFFHYTDLNGRLNSNMSLCSIVELVFIFTLEIPMDKVVQLTGN